MWEDRPIVRTILTLILALFGLALFVDGASAQDAQRRVALLIGQSAYPGGSSATIGLPALDNPARDAQSMVELLGRHGFEVISCDGNTPGCHDLDRARLLKALTQL